MSRFSSITSRTGTSLPQVFWPAHELCFRAHDVMTHLLVSGERAKAFTVKFVRANRAPNTDDLIRMGEKGAAAGTIKATPWMRFKGWLAARRQA